MLFLTFSHLEALLKFPNMRIQVVIISLLFSVSSVAQCEDIWNNIFGLELHYKMPRESFQNLKEIHTVEGPDDSCYLVEGAWTQDLKRIKYYPLQLMYPGQSVKTYLFKHVPTDSFFVFLNFYDNRLIGYDVLFATESLKEKMQAPLDSEMYVYRKDRNCTHGHAFTLGGKYPLYHFGIFDPMAYKIMPSWCGTCNRSDTKAKSWKKLGEYVNEPDKKSGH